MSKVEREISEHAKYKVPTPLHPDTPHGPDAGAIDRQALITALAAKLQSRMTDVVRRCYSRSAEGVWWNLDGETGRILFGLPWAEFSHQSWQLVRSECDLMRMCVRHFRRTNGGPFYYQKRSTRWYLDIAAYPTMAHVTGRPEVWVITPELLLAADNHRRGLPYAG